MTGIQPAPPIPQRSDEQFVRELEARMARLRGKLCSCGRPVASECCGRVSRYVAEAMNAIGDAE